MKTKGFRFFSPLFLAILITGLNLLFNANASALVIIPYPTEESLFDKGNRMEEELRASLPAPTNQTRDPYLEAFDIAQYKIVHPEIYSGFAVEGKELILKLSKKSKEARAQSQRIIALKIAKKNGATKVRYVDYTLNELYALYAKVSYYMHNDNKAGINMAALDDSRGFVEVGLEDLNEESIKRAKELLGESSLLRYVSFQYNDD